MPRQNVCFCTSLAIAALFCCAGAADQIPTAPPQRSLVVGTFHSPLKGEKLFAALDQYHREQIGKSALEALPAISPGKHYSVWRDMWVFLSPAAEGTAVTLLKAADENARRTAKVAMLELSGAMQTDAPVAFEARAPLAWFEKDVFASGEDLARAVKQAGASLTRITTWRHSGLFVSADPVASLSIVSSASHDAALLVAVGEPSAHLQQTIPPLVKILSGPRICAMRSETELVEKEITRRAEEVGYDVAARTLEFALRPQFDSKVYEARTRQSPEMQRRLVAARDTYSVLLRPGAKSRRVRLEVFELAGSNQASGASVSSRRISETVQAAGAADAKPSAARLRIPGLQPGTYRVVMSAEAPGAPPIDERIFSYDGHVFREISR